MTQFSTAIAAYCGTFIGLFGMDQMKQIIGYDLMVPFTAGGFIYLAAVTILPSLLEEKKGGGGGGGGLIVRILHVISFIVGIGFMYYVTILEHSGSGGFLHSNEHHHHHHDHHDNNGHHHDNNELHDHHNMDHHSHSHNHGHAHAHAHNHHHDEF